MDVLDYLPFFASIGNILFISTLPIYTDTDYKHYKVLYEYTPNSIRVLLYWAFLWSLIHMLIPTDRLNKALFKLKETRQDKLFYEEAKLSFFTDYDIENPHTREETLKKLIERS